MGQCDDDEGRFRPLSSKADAERRSAGGHEDLGESVLVGPPQLRLHHDEDPIVVLIFAERNAPGQVASLSIGYRIFCPECLICPPRGCDRRQIVGNAVEMGLKSRRRGKRVLFKHYVRRATRRAMDTTARHLSPRLFAASSSRRGGARSYRIVRLDGLPTVSLINPQLQLPAQRLHALEDVRRLLASAGLRHWILPTESNEPTAVCLASSDQSSFYESLSLNRSLRHWYVSPLTDRGQTMPSVFHTYSRALRRFNAVRLWEVVSAGTSSSFASGPQQGVEVQFWSESDDGLLYSPVWREQATALSPTQALDQDVDGVPRVWSTHTHLSRTTLPIDVVFTWVDGSDPAWLEQKAESVGVLDVSTFTERAQDAARFADHDELRFSLRSLEQFAPWVNKIWIVTSGQIPEWLDESNPKVEVVRHSQIWPDEEGLPTFNSHAIEACLHRIPGLAEHFLYLNDDMILGRPVSPGLFFYPSGVGKAFQSRALVDHAPSAAGEVASSSAAKNARSVLVHQFKRVPTRKFFHTAAPLRVSVLEEIERQNEELFRSTRSATFRTTHDIAAAGSLYLNHALATGHSVPGRIRYEYIDPATPDGQSRLARVLKSRAFDAFCLNDGATEQSEPERKESDRIIRRALAEYLPVPSQYEKD